MKTILLMTTVFCLLAHEATAYAAAPETPLRDKPASARSLPGDNLPPFGMLDDSGNLVPRPPMSMLNLRRGPRSSPESAAPGPSLSLAIKAAQAAVHACGVAGYPVGATVVDSAGEARAMLTADKSDGSHVFVAMRKALTALAFAMASSKASEAVSTDRLLLGRVTPSMFVEGGALPIIVGGKIIGALGVSGAAGSPIGYQDELCATAGLKIFTAGLASVETAQPIRAERHADDP